MTAVLALVLCAWWAWGWLTLVAGLAGAPELPPARGRLPRLAVLIPAHNEAAVIANTVRAMLLQAYPEKYAVIVVADRCTDETAELARAAGAIVWERSEGPQGKGAALAWALERLPDWVDAVSVFDADNRPGPGALHALGAALASGAPAAQMVVAPMRARHWLARQYAHLSAITAAMMVGRARLGAPVYLGGTGWAVTRATLDRVPWAALTVTEDTEYTVRLLLAGLRVRLVPAWTWDEKPTSVAASLRQIARWQRGGLQIVAGYWRELVRQLWRPAVWDAVGVCLQPLMMAYAGLALAVGLIHAGVSAVAVPAALMTIQLSLALIGWGARRWSLPAMLLWPFWYIVTWAPASLWATLTWRSRRWARTPHVGVAALLVVALLVGAAGPALAATSTPDWTIVNHEASSVPGAVGEWIELDAPPPSWGTVKVSPAPLVKGSQSGTYRFFLEVFDTTGQTVWTYDRTYNLNAGITSIIRCTSCSDLPRATSAAKFRLTVLGVPNGTTYVTVTNMQWYSPDNVKYSPDCYPDDPLVTVSGQTEMNPPGTPQGLTATAQGPHSIRASWSAVTGATGYEVSLDGQTWTDVGASTQYTWTVDDNQTYTVHVRAYNGDGYSPEATATVTTPPGWPQSSPAPVTVSNIGTHKATASWAAVAGATGYQWSLDGSIWTSVGSSRTYTWSNLAGGTKYTVHVRGYNNDGPGPEATATFQTLTAPPPPNPPAWVQVTDVTQTTAHAAWATIPGVSTYRLWLNGIMVQDVQGTSFDLSGLSPGTDYTLAVAGVDPQGGPGAQATAKFRTADAPAPGPITLTATADPGGPVHLSWTAPTPAADTIRVYRNGIVFAELEGTATSYDDPTVHPGGTYSYFLRAFNVGGQTDSNTVQITVPDAAPEPGPPNGLSGLPDDTGYRVTWHGAGRHGWVPDHYTVAVDGIDVGVTLPGDAGEYAEPDRGWATGEKHTITVTAWDAAGNPYPASVDVTIWAAGAVPTDPAQPISAANWTLSGPILGILSLVLALALAVWVGDRFLVTVGRRRVRL